MDLKKKAGQAKKASNKEGIYVFAVVPPYSLQMLLSNAKHEEILFFLRLNAKKSG